MPDIIDINISPVIETVALTIQPNLTTINVNTITGGGGAVTSVNTETGDVVLNQDEILDGTTFKQYSLTEKNKLAGIAAGAEVNVNADWNATTGDAQILNKPTIPAAQVNSDWNATSGVAQILNKPTITTPTLQEVTTAGAITTNTIRVESLSDDYSIISPDTIGTVKTIDEIDETYAYLSNLGSLNLGNGDVESRLRNTNVTAATVTLEFPDKVTGSYIIATTDDIPTNTSDLTNNGADGVNPFITALDIPTTGQASTIVREVKNMTGATLTKGTVVYISGANGNKALVSKALATTDALSSRTFGLLQSNISNNGLGNCVIIGDLSGLDTSAFTEGAQLYLSGVTAGTYTDTKILAPTHLVYVGKVTRSHPTQGQIEVGIQNGYELSEIHDVALSSETNNQVLTYESSTDLWKNKSIGTILGYTPYRNVQTSQTVLTGTTAETIIFTATIPANAFNSNDIMKVLFGANKSTGLGTYVLRLRINTTNTISGAPTIALYNGTSTSQISIMMRNFSLNGGNLYGLGGGNSGITDIVAVGSALGSTTLNPANIFYIFATITLQNSGDSIIGNMLSIHN